MKRALEIIFKEDVQRIFDHFSLCHNVRILFWTPEGEKILVGLNRPTSPYCTLIRNQLRRVDQCKNLDQLKREEARKKGEMICYQCHAGLTEAIKPIYFDGNLIGFALVAQFRSAQDIPADVMRDWRRSHPASEIEAAYAATPLVPQAQLDAILDLFSVLVDYVVSQRMITLKGSVAVQEIISYMESHLHEDLSVSEVARTFYKSPSTLLHVLKSKTGKSFKETLVEMRISKAEECMALNPDLTVAEAAAKVGYSNPYYFSRLYKRHRGMPPGRFLKQCRSLARQ